MAADGVAGPAAGPSGSPLVPDALAFLHGRWRLERRLVDHAAGCGGTFSGTAEFAFPGPPAPPAAPPAASGGGTPEASAPDRRALTYHEHGELRFGGHRGPASRSLIYFGRPDGTADVCFADGRDFYHLDPRSGSWQGEHQCGADHYAVAGKVLSSGKFQERWRARGPDTDYEIFATLVRA